MNDAAEQISNMRSETRKTGEVYYDIFVLNNYETHTQESEQQMR